VRLVLCLSALLFSSRGFAQAFDSDTRGALPVHWLQGVTGEGHSQWTVEADDSAPSKPNVLRKMGVSTYAWCIREDASAESGTISVKIKLTSGSEDQAGGLIWKWKNPENYYIARINALEDNVVLFSMVGGKRKALKVIDMKVSAQSWHTLQVHFKGTRISVSFDEKKVLETDSVELPGSGKVGLWAKSDSVTSFDNFSFSREK
jgi:hypothetical protein